jgi:hypothetical protein
MQMQNTINRITYITYIPQLRAYCNRVIDIAKDRAFNQKEAQDYLTQHIQKKSIVTAVHHLQAKLV